MVYFHRRMIGGKVVTDEFSRKHYGVNKDTKFDFWSELRKFDSEAKKYLDKIITEPKIRERIDKQIFKKMIIFKLRKSPIMKTCIKLLKRYKSAYKLLKKL